MQKKANKAKSSKKPLNDHDVCQLQVKPESSSADIIGLSDTSDAETEGSSSEHWLKIGKFTLRAEHKEALSSNKWLNDYHIACAQTLLKSQFPQLGGLQPTIGQGKYLKQLPMDCDSIQVLFIAGNHWAAVSTMNCAKGKELVFYDSLNSAVSDETKRLLCKLIHTNDDHFRIRFANVVKQSGVNDCGLFVIAYITHLAFGKDPSCCVFAQSEMRSHLLASFEQQRITPFPVIRERRPLPQKLVIVKVYCYCRCIEDDFMISCDGPCNGWYHLGICVDAKEQSSIWYCRNCRNLKSET